MKGGLERAKGIKHNLPILPAKLLGDSIVQIQLDARGQSQTNATCAAQLPGRWGQEALGTSAVFGNTYPSSFEKTRGHHPIHILYLVLMALHVALPPPYWFQ